MPYASDIELNGPSRYDNQFKRPTSESNPPQVLVQWEGTDEAEATQENVAKFQANFPNFNLEDKVVLKGDGIVMISDKGKLLEGKK